MFVRSLVISVVLVLFFCAAVYAQATPEGIFSGKGPVEIKADKLTSDQKRGVTVFEGSVVAKQDNSTLRADRMEVYTDEKGSITRIIAVGNVVLEKQGQSISSSMAEYIHNERIIVFTGGPVARGEGTTIMGERIIYHTEDGKTTVEQSRVIIERKDTGGRP